VRSSVDCCSCHPCTAPSSLSAAALIDSKRGVDVRRGFSSSESGAERCIRAGAVLSVFSMRSASAIRRRGQEKGTNGLHTNTTPQLLSLPRPAPSTLVPGVHGGVDLAAAAAAAAPSLSFEDEFAQLILGGVSSHVGINEVGGGFTLEAPRS
jgi:hypothetical protein